MRLITILLLASLAFPALSAWKINPEVSSLSFVSIKKNAIAENNEFKRFSGEVSTGGKLNVDIELSSVATKIDIRDQRLRDFVFEVSKFASANYQAKIDMKAIAALTIGESVSMVINGTLNLHGHSQPIDAEVVVVKVSDTNMLVTTKQPMLVKAPLFGLESGISHLQSLANLPSISRVVPVSFVISFNLS